MTDPVGHKIKFDHVMIHDGDRIYRFRYDLKGWDTPPCYLPEEYLGKHLYDEDVDDVFMGRIVAWLVHSGIRTFSDLTACTYEQLKDLPGIGESLANVVKGRLAMIGLSLKPTVIVVDKEQESVDGNVKLLTE